MSKQSGKGKSKKGDAGCIGFAYGGIMKNTTIRTFMTEDSDLEKLHTELQNYYGPRVQLKYTEVVEPSDMLEKYSNELGDANRVSENLPIFNIATSEASHKLFTICGVKSCKNYPTIARKKEESKDDDADGQQSDDEKPQKSKKKVAKKVESDDDKSDDESESEEDTPKKGKTASAKKTNKKTSDTNSSEKEAPKKKQSKKEESDDDNSDESDDEGDDEGARLKKKSAAKKKSANAKSSK